MTLETDAAKIHTRIGELKRFWDSRHTKFLKWYELLVLVDKLASKGMESYVSNEPQTFYNMAHYLLTKGDISHTVPVISESVLEFEKRARVHRGCEYMWKQIDTWRQEGGNQPFIDELGFFLLVLGWYSVLFWFDEKTGLLHSDVWSPADTFPMYQNGMMTECVHSYEITGEEAKQKADENNWSYKGKVTYNGRVTINNYFVQDSNGLHNIVLVDQEDVTGWVDRPEAKVLVAPVGGFPDKGTLTPVSWEQLTWKQLTGRGIFEVNQRVAEHFNKWKSMISQILRDTAQPITQEFSAEERATPEQIRERGALFHYNPGEQGLQRVSPGVIPIELQAHILEMRRESQKGSFNDAVYGMVEGRSGYALSLLASSSANQILYPYMDGKHFVVSQADKFWLSKLKSSRRVFEVKGKFVEKLKPVDIPEDVIVEVSSDVATPKDWMERGTIAGLMRQDVDKTTLLADIYKFTDPQGIIRRKDLDDTLDHPLFKQAKMVAIAYNHAKFLQSKGDRRQAAIFNRVAQSLEAQLGVPPPGSPKPAEATEVAQKVEEGTPEEKANVRPEVMPPEARGFSPQALRRLVGRGTLKAV